MLMRNCTADAEEAGRTRNCFNSETDGDEMGTIHGVKPSKKTLMKKLLKEFIQVDKVMLMLMDVLQNRV